MLLLVVAILPIVLIGLYLYNKDKNKEPTSLLLKLFFSGIGSIFLVLFFSYLLCILMPFFDLEIDKLNCLTLIPYVFIGISLIEEISKWIFVYKISYNNKEFDEFYDIILYSTFVALGFACLENILYVFQNGFNNGLLRAITAVPGHVFFGVFMGYYLGIAKINAINNRLKQSQKNLILSIIIPIIIHGIYDYLLYAFSITSSWIFIILWLGLVVFMYIYCIKRIMKVSNLTGKFINNNNIYK